MQEQRFSHRGLATIGLLGFGFALIAAGCGGGGSGSSSVTPSLSTPAPGASCAAGTGGVAYVPDGGATLTTGTTTGLRIVPFETTGHLFSTSCAQSFLTTSGSLRDLSVSTSGDAIGIEVSGAKTYIVGFNGLNSGSAPYLTPLNVDDSTAFTGGNPPTSLALLPAGTYGIAVGIEPSPAPSAGFLGVNNILGIYPSPLPTTATATATPSTSPTPQATATAYLPAIVNPAQVPYTSIGAEPSASPYVPSSALGIPTGSVLGRPSVALGPDGATILVRGDKDLVGFGVTGTAGGYFFTYPANGTTSSVTGSTTIVNGINTTLGFSSNITSASGLLGHGLIAYSPTSAARVILGGTGGSTGTSNPNIVSLLTQAPSNLSSVATYTANAPVTSLAIDAGGDVAAVGTSNGLTILKGINSGTLTAVTQTTFTGTISYTKPGATSAQSLANIVSVGFSSDGNYLIVLADNGDSTGTLLAFLISSSGILTSPVATSSTPVAIGNAFPLPAGDYMVVR